jgi:tetratricopeptide (TPR) repeat protein
VTSPPEVEKLAESVADGEAVDWETHARDASDPDRKVIQELRLIASIAAFSRTFTLDEAASPLVSEPDPPSAPAPHGRWGPFDLVQKIGEGAFGDVYRARDALHRDVALKLLSPVSGASDEQLAARILHEGRVLARVRHPSVVTVYGAEEHAGRVGLWMEFIEGRTLEALLHAQGPFGGREAALVGRELCRALAAVHGAGLVHRDIKAQNVMREAGGRLVLMDFGAGQILQPEGTGAGLGRVTGTPLYLAPELLGGQPATVRSDIYSLGVLLYHLVTNAYPVRVGSLDELRKAHARGQRRPLTDLRPDLPDDFVRAVERAIDPDPARRYPSAGAFAEALTETLSADHTMSAEVKAGTRTGERPAEPAPVPAAPASWRRRLAYAGGATLLAGALLVGGVWWWRAGEPARTGAAATQTLRIAVRGLADGDDPTTSLLTDQILHDLGGSPYLRVIAPAAVDALRDRPASALMQSLEADVVVDVTGRKEGEGAAATVRVARGVQPPILLASRASASSGLRDLARELAGRVVEVLELDDQTWKPSLRSELPLDNPQAIQAFRVGLAALGRGGREDVLAASRHFRDATVLAPDFVLAYARWAEALLSVYRHNAISASEAFPVAQDAIAQALRRDEASGEAHAALADLQVEKDRDWARAEATFRRALELSPSSEYARIRFAMMLSGRGRTEEAVALSLEAQSLNPRSSALRGYAGAALHYAGRYAEAAKMYEGTLQLDPDYSAAWIGLCKAYTALGRFDQALTACEKVREAGAAEPSFVESQLVQVHADAGRPRDAARHLEALQAIYDASPNGDTAFWLALACVSLGDADRAFRWLDEAIDRRSSRLLYARVDARLDPIRNDPRFAERQERMERAYR